MVTCYFDMKISLVATVYSGTLHRARFHNGFRILILCNALSGLVLHLYGLHDNPHIINNIVNIFIVEV